MSIFNRKYDIKKEIATLHEELRTIEGLKDFVKNPVWLSLREMMIDKMITYSDSIITLSANVAKNKDEIQHKHSLRFACKGLIEGVETTLEAESEIKEKIRKLEQATVLAELQGDDLT